MKVNYVDILLWTAKMLKEQYPSYNIYVDDNQEYITLPSFNIEVIPMSTEEKFGKNKYKVVNLLIEYINIKAFNEEKLQVIDDISDLIGKGISVIQSNGTLRTLPVFNKKPTMGSIANLLVTLEYFDGVLEHPEKANDSDAYDELMGILSLNIKEKQ